MSTRTLIVTLSLASAFLWPGYARADCLYLKSGGTVEGEWLNRSVHPSQYEVMTALGRVTVQAAQVERIEIHKPAVSEYRQRAPLIEDSVAAQWEWATWCRDHDLHDQRQSHLRRVVSLDPDHYEARQLLGYTYQNGTWIARDEMMRRKGYVRSDDRWQLNRKVELAQQQKQREQAELEWLLRLRRLREALGGKRAQEAISEFVQIRDPHAVPALRQLMSEDRWQPAKLLYLKTLREIGTPAAIALMFDTSIRDLDREVRLTSLEQLTAMNPAGLAREYIKVLKSKNNVEVNRAAIALQYLEDRSTVMPLIDALVTQHTLVLPGRGSADTMTTTFSADGGSGLSTGSKSKSITGRVRNGEVLAALTQITGRNFGFDQAAWNAWFASEAQAELRQ